MFRCFFGIDLSQDVNQSHEHALVSEKKYKSGFSIAAYCVCAVFSASCSGDAVINIVLFSFVIITISVYTEKRITRHRAICPALLVVLLYLSKAFAYSPLLLLLLLFVPE